MYFREPMVRISKNGDVLSGARKYQRAHYGVLVKSVLANKIAFLTMKSFNYAKSAFL